MTDFIAYPYIVLGIDPGPHTGIVRIDGQTFTYAETAWIGGDVPYLATVQEMERALNIAYLHSAPLYIVVERFNTIQPGVGNTRVAIDTIKLIGAIDYWCLRERNSDHGKYGLHLVWQTSSMRKPFEAHARALIKLRGYGSVHECSALAHALACQRRHLGAEVISTSFA